MASFPFILPTPEILLVAITLVPLLVAWALGLFSSAPEDAGVIRMGNPLRAGPETFDHDATHEPVLHLARTQTVAQLRDLALGLRNAPVEQAAPLLKHFMRSTDPELALFAQSILQQGRERLQTTLGQLQNLHDQTDPRIAASLLETSLRLASPALTAADEREGRIQQLAKKAADQLASCDHTPRLLAACARIFLVAGAPEKAASIVGTMPQDSALRHVLDSEVSFALNIRESAAAN